MIERPDQLIDIYDIWYQPFWKQGWFYTTVIFSISIMIAGILKYIYRAYTTKKQTVDCSIIALKELDFLESFHIVTVFDSKDFYFKLSSIIKQYLSLRFHQSFMKLTDQEIMRVSEKYLSEDDQRLLQRVLQGMVYSKFDYKFATRDRVQDIDMIREMIKHTSRMDDTKEI